MENWNVLKYGPFSLVVNNKVRGRIHFQFVVAIKYIYSYSNWTPYPNDNV